MISNFDDDFTLDEVINTKSTIPPKYTNHPLQTYTDTIKGGKQLKDKFVQRNSKKVTFCPSA